MQKWEYIRAGFIRSQRDGHLRLHVSDNDDRLKPFPETTTPLQLLSALGEQGWELISETPYAQFISSRVLVHNFPYKPLANSKTYDYMGEKLPLIDFLNKLGQDGWEFVQETQPHHHRDDYDIYFKQNTYKIASVIFTFKRPYSE